ncbi:MAG: cation-transporting P-type ATPase [Candidatus Moranbacteria bacterium]|nr:cation-transporting P-type ATPase [Candidatus Moranbacteria bacterium]
MPTERELHELTPVEVFGRLGTSANGLSEEEASTRLRTGGENRIERKRKLTAPALFLRQFNDVFVWILGVAGFAALLLGEFRDTSVILVIILSNAVIGFIQEYKAERIIEKLATFVADTATVVRDGEKREVPVTGLVTGDVVFLDAGASVPADGYVLEAYNLKVNSFIFTGESVPENRLVGPSPDVPGGEPRDLVFMGESVASGEARVVVSGTGMATKLGRMAELTRTIDQDPTPLQKKMHRFGNGIAFLSVSIGGIVMMIGHSQHLPTYQSLLLALALSVSVVPEGLPAALSVSFALGMKRLLKKRVLAKRLSAVETLGSVSVICSDKTGTITKNELSVTKIVLGTAEYDLSGIGYEPKGDFSREGKLVNPSHIPGAEMLFRIGVLCNDASLGKSDGRYVVTGDPTEGAIIVAARKYNARPDFFEVGYRKVAENPFEAERRRMSVIYVNAETSSFVKGSPDVLLDLCDEWTDGETKKPFSAEDKAAVRAVYERLSGQALRVLAFAYRDLDDVPEKKYPEEMERNLVWAGMMAMIDPPREGIREAIAECRTLGVSVVMVTGDYETTARAIARKVGLFSEEADIRVVNGSSFDALPDAEIVSAVREGAVFARIAPEQKLRIASALQKAGEVVAMTGDGVNDALALKKADIGVAMGVIGTDVSKDAADMILLDDHFASIVSAVREGRRIFENLRKFVHYVFTSNASELFTVLLGFLLHIPSPVSAVQILSIDLATDVFPSFALGVEPEEPDSMSHAVPAKGRRIMDGRGVVRLLSIGVIMAVGAVTAFLLALIREGWTYGASIDASAPGYLHATTAAYVTLALTQMANLFQSRSERRSFFRMPFFSNPWVFVGFGVSLSMLFLFTNVPFFQRVLGMAPIERVDWIVAWCFTALVFVFEEARKRRLSRKS